MNVETKLYRFGGHTIRVRLERPWTFKALTQQQLELTERLRRGEDIGIESVPADRQEQLSVNESLMGKEAMTREIWDTLDETERSEYRHALDFLQYAPFEVSEGDPVFTLTVRADVPAWLEESRPAWKMVTAVDELPPYYYGYTHEGKTIYEYLMTREIRAGYFVMNKDYTEGDYYPCPRIGGRTTLFQVNTSLMIQYTFATAGLSTLLLHASVTRYEGRGNLFFGVSGTGKSTHSRLWHEFVPGSDLMNDDNPVIRFEDGRCLVYGSPWSGKTLCYRNVVAPVNALVRLEQFPENRISRLEPLQAYASVIAAVSTIRWNHDIMSLLVPTIERVAMTVPCFQLKCRPDEEAVAVCKAAVYPSGH
jgi:hypothetical protein